MDLRVTDATTLGQGEVVKIVQVIYTDPAGHARIETYLRDAREVDGFLRGVECNDRGIATREGCTEDAELMIRLDRVLEIVDRIG